MSYEQIEKIIRQLERINEKLEKINESLDASLPDTAGLDHER